MNIHIRNSSVAVTESLRAHVERRLGLALGRFGAEIGRVVVSFADTDGTEGAATKMCHVTLALPRSLHITEADADVFAAVDRAADRAARSVARRLELERSSH